MCAAPQIQRKLTFSQAKPVRQRTLLREPKLCASFRYRFQIFGGYAFSRVGNMAVESGKCHALMLSHRHIPKRAAE